MDVETTRIITRTCDMLFRCLTTRFYTFTRVIENALTFDGQFLASINDLRLKLLSKPLTGRISQDDVNYNSFNPPRMLRAAIALIVSIEKVAVVIYPWLHQRLSAQTVASQAVRVAFLNLLPSCLLAMPENLVVSCVMRQCREQWCWAHTLLR